MDPTDYEQLQQDARNSTEYKITRKSILKRTNDGWRRIIQSPDHEEIIRALHDQGHLGVKSVMSKLKQRYWWPKMQKHVEEYIRTCDTCQRDKLPPKATDIYPIFAERPFQIIGIDHVGYLPKSKKQNAYQYVIVAQDYFTKWPMARAVATTRTDEALDFVWEEIITKYGTPERIISDQGSAFISDHWKRTMRKWNIEHVTTTAMNPQANGQVERFNGTLMQMVRRSLKKDKTKWPEQIQTVLMAYRTSVQTATGKTPSELLYGFQMKLPIDNKYPVDPEEIIEEPFQQRIEELKALEQKRLLVADRLEQQKIRMKEKYEQGKLPIKEYEPGDTVLYKMPKTNKLDLPMQGPFKIKKVLGKRRYQLETMGGAAYKVVTGRRLTPWFDRSKARVEVESHLDQPLDD